MFDSLRSRFVLSHVLPMFIVIPLMGIALTYILETQLLIQNLSEELHNQAEMVARMTGDRSGIWYDRDQAQAFIAYLTPALGTSITLLDAHGYLLASSDATDGQESAQPVEAEAWPTVQAGGVSVRKVYSQRFHAQVVEVLVPVSGPDDEVAGVVRISQELAGVSERFTRLRYLVAGVLLGGLLIGAIVGWVLALNLERPLRQVTSAVQRLTTGEQLQPLVQEGPREIRLLSQSVNTLVERLYNLEQARRQLLSNLVHELGRPLGAMRSAIQALLGGADEEPAFRHELLLGMQGQTDQLERLLDDLTGLHGQALGPLKIERIVIDPLDWLGQVLPAWREAAQAKGLRWSARVPDQLPFIEGDPDRLTQALGNLLSNAIKFTPSGGAVSTAAGVEEDMLWIRVGDTGPGITPEEQEQIFRPLYRGPAGRRFPQGMGLGLSIARDLIAAHGGRLEASSEPGVGSQFTIWLPLAATNP